MSEAIQNLARQLEEAGVRHVFGITGSGSTMDLITALEKMGATYYPVAHEAAGAIMAGAVARVLDQPAVSLSIKGPGLANMAAGIAANALEGYPALSISEAYGSDAPAYRRHKRLDQRAMLAPITKAIADLGTTNLAQVLTWAQREPRGPIHLELSWGGPPPECVGQLSTGNMGIAKIEACLKEAKRPLVIVGSLALRRSWGKQVQELRVPVMTTVAAKGLLDERTDYAGGIFTGAGRDLAPETSLLKSADMVLGLGLHNDELLGFPFPELTMLVDEVATACGGYPNGQHVCIATEAQVARLLAALAEREWGRAQVAEIRDRLALSAHDGAWLPAACFGVLNQASLDVDLVCDTGSFCTVGEHLFQARPDRMFYCSAKGRNMGTGVPTALGVAIARPGKAVVCACGDGGMAMYPSELKLAAAEHLPICFVLMSDGRYGSIACVPQSQEMSARAVTIRAPSWRETVASFGIPAHEARNAAEFSYHYSNWDARGPLFIECRFEAEAYRRMTEALR